MRFEFTKIPEKNRRRSPLQIERGEPDPTVTRPRRETPRQIARTLSNMKHEAHYGVKDRKTKWKTMVEEEDLNEGRGQEEVGTCRSPSHRPGR